MKILIIEDDVRIANNISEFFKVKTSFSTQITGTFEEAEYLLDNETFDATILDWMLPDGDGLELLKSIRSKGIIIPVLMLTAKSETEDKVAGLEYGADDYLTKPFVLEELLARINTIIRRKQLQSSTPLITNENLTINTNTREVLNKTRQINLAPREYELLEYLALNKDLCLSRQDLLDHVWGEEVDPFSNTVDVHIRYLRKKIGIKNLIKTIKGKGYMLCSLQPGKSSR